jgi:hypothetical protein
MKKIVCLACVLLLTACGGSKPSVFVTKNCSIDAPVSNSTLSAKTPFTLGGWVFDKQSVGSQSQVQVQFVSADRMLTKTFDDTLGGKRPDVAAAYKDQKAESSDFTISIPADSLKPGSYEITILQDVSNGVVACGYGHTVVITK